MEQIKIGIIGGSGLYQMPELENVKEIEVDTPFGKPSDAFIVGQLEGVKVAFLPRHARGHKFTPSELPGKYLRDDETRRRIHRVGLSRRIAPRAVRSDRYGDSRSVLRPHARTGS